MNLPQCNAYDDIQFLMSTPRTYSCTEAARVQPEPPNPPAHEALTRLLYRLEPTPEPWWVEAKSAVPVEQGLLVIDDARLAKPSAKPID